MEGETMKKIMTIMLLAISLLVLSGCIDDQKGIDYHSVVNVPSTIEVDIEDVPDSFERYVPVDETYVLKVSFDLDEVIWSVEGDHPIKITIDYTDGTSLTFNSVLRLVYNEKIGIPRIIGVKNRLISVGTESIDLLEGVAFTDDSKIVDSGILGSIEFGVEGVYTVVYYAEDDEGNFVSTSSFVVIGDNLPHYENLLNSFEAVYAEDKPKLRAYALLYTAAIEKYPNSDTKVTLDYYGYFINQQVYEELLQRKLRPDEVRCIEEVKSLFKRNDRMRYENFFDVSLSAQENEHFDTVYEIFDNYSKTIHPNNIESGSSITEVTDIELYLSGSTELTEEQVTSLAFYRVYSNLSIDPIYFEVIANTDYLFDYRLLEVTDTSVFKNIKSRVDELNPYEMSDPETYVQTSSNEDEEFLDIYLEYAHYKNIYLIHTKLKENGSTIDIDTVEDFYFKVLLSIELDPENILLRENMIDIKLLEEILQRDFSTLDELAYTEFEEAFNYYFHAPYTNHYKLFNEYLTIEEKELIKTTYIHFKIANMDIPRYNMDYYSSKELFHGDMEDSYDGVNLINKFDPIVFEDKYIEYIQTFDFEREEVDYILSSNRWLRYTGDPWEEINPMLYVGSELSLIDITPETIQRKLQVLDMFHILYPSYDNEGVRHMDNIITVFQAHSLEMNVIASLLSSNDLDHFISVYNINFTANETKIIEDYITWSSAYIYQHLNNPQNLLALELCDGGCEEEMNEIYEYLFPSTYLLQYGYLSMSTRSLEVSLGKETPDGLDDNFDMIRAAYDEFDTFKGYYERNFSYNINTMYGSHSYDFVFDSESYKHIPLMKSVYDKRMDLPYRIDLAMNVIEEDILELLTQEEYDMLAYYYYNKLARTNQHASDDLYDLIIQYQQQDILPDYIIAITAMNHHNIRITGDESFNPNQYGDMMLESELEAISTIYDFLTYIDYHIRYVSKLHIPADVDFDFDSLTLGIEAMFEIGYNPNQFIYHLIDLYKNHSENPDFMNLSVEKQEAILRFLEYKFKYIEGDFIQDEMALVALYIDQYADDFYELSFKIILEGYDMNTPVEGFNTEFQNSLTPYEKSILALFQETKDRDLGSLLNNRLILFEAFGLLEGTYTMESFMIYSDEYLSENLMDMLTSLPEGIDPWFLLRTVYLDDDTELIYEDIFDEEYISQIYELYEKIIDFEERLETEYIYMDELHALQAEAMGLFLYADRDYDTSLFGVYTYTNILLEGTSIFDVIPDLALKLNTLFMAKQYEQFLLEDDYDIFYYNSFRIHQVYLPTVREIYYHAKYSAFTTISNDEFQLAHNTYAVYYEGYMYLWAEGMYQFEYMFPEEQKEEAYVYFHDANRGMAYRYIRNTLVMNNLPEEEYEYFMQYADLFAFMIEEEFPPEYIMWDQEMAEYFGITPEQMIDIERLFNESYLVD